MKGTPLLFRAFFNSQTRMSLISYPLRGIKSPPVFNEDNLNKINSFNGDLSAYFEDLMRRRPTSPTGYISLPKENFRRMVEKMKTPTDVVSLVNAYANYLGHRNVLPHSYVDQMLLKAIEVGNPEGALEIIRLHTELSYHPSAQVVEAYFKHFKKAGYEKFKLFFSAVRGNYLL